MTRCTRTTWRSTSRASPVRPQSSPEASTWRTPSRHRPPCDRAAASRSHRPALGRSPSQPRAPDRHDAAARPAPSGGQPDSAGAGRRPSASVPQGPGCAVGWSVCGLGPHWSGWVFRTGREPVDAWGAQGDQQKAARVLACRQVRDRVLQAQAQSAARAALRYRQRLLQEAAVRPSCALTGSALRQRPLQISSTLTLVPRCRRTLLPASAPRWIWWLHPSPKAADS